MFFQNFFILSVHQKTKSLPLHYYTSPIGQFLAASSSKCLRYNMGETKKSFRFNEFIHLTQIFHNETVDPYNVLDSLRYKLKRFLLGDFT